jgi:hypothetical protein
MGRTAALMPKPSYAEEHDLEEFLQMGDGYVLGFSNRTMKFRSEKCGFAWSFEKGQIQGIVERYLPRMELL